ncbi:MAG: UpxY family transcription antiterminator [Chitinophaga sp.]|uniref:UpxY family transcription antiterminator n=1 Tax=Chitinophaga sp. TaxID=1869181 RepID=UPI001B242F8E|nr:UpxY family transcription antiterminator [Chitinophaga sp.]MBO9732444.1 UpxY family transcription antiterminator [Chitinophaga sp.]
MNTPISGWYVIYTRPRHEKKVAVQLSQANIVFFLPTLKTLRVYKDRKRNIDAPLFPSYIFIYVNDLDEYYRALSINGTLYYVRSGDKVAKVSETVIHNIRLLLAEGNDQDIEVSDAYFRPGKQVLIKDGIMTGLYGEIVEFKGTRKILIRITLMRRNILVTLPCNDLVADPV